MIERLVAEWREHLKAATPDEDKVRRLLDSALANVDTPETHTEVRRELRELAVATDALGSGFRHLLTRVEKLEEEWKAAFRYTSEGLARLERDLVAMVERRPQKGARFWFNELADAFRALEVDALIEIASVELPFPKEFAAGAATIRGAMGKGPEGDPDTTLDLLQAIGEGAIKGWEAALDPPTRARALRLAAYIALSIYDDHERSRGYVDAAVEVEPYNGPSHAERAAFYLFVGEFDLAVTDAQHAIDLAPSDPAGYLNLGIWAEVTGDFDNAREHFQSALARMNLHAASKMTTRASLLPPTGLLLLTAAEHLLHEDRPAAALDAAYAALTTGVRGREEFPDAEVFRVISLAHEGLREHSAADVAEAALEAGKRYLWNGNGATAIQLLDRALAFDDSYPEIGWFRADTLVVLASEEGATSGEYYREAREMWEEWARRFGPPEGESSWAYMTRAIIADAESDEAGADRRAGLWEALLYTERSLTHETYDGRRWGFAARYLHGLELDALALEAAEYGFTFDDTDPVVLEQRVSLLADAGRFDEAEETIRNSPDTIQLVPWLAGARAWVARRQGRNEDAIEFVSVPIAAAWDLAWCYDLRALCHLARGEVEAAHAEYAAVLATVEDGTISPAAIFAASIQGDLGKARKWLEGARDRERARDDTSIPAVEAFIELAAGNFDHARKLLSDAVAMTLRLRELDELMDNVRLRLRALPNPKLLEERERVVRAVEEELVPRKRSELAAVTPTADDQIAQAVAMHHGAKLGHASLILLAADGHRAVAREDAGRAVDCFEGLLGSAYEPEATLGHERALYSVASAAAENGDVEGVRSAYRQLRQHEYANAIDATFAIASTLESAGRLDEARRELAEAARKHAHEAGVELVHQRLGDLALADEDARRAVRHFGRALALVEDSPYAAAILETRLAVSRLVADDNALVESNVARAIDAWRSAGVPYPAWAVLSEAQTIEHDEMFPIAVRQAAESVASIAEAHDPFAE